MPNFTFKCSNCNSEFNVFVSYNKLKNINSCDVCKSQKIKRIYKSGTTFIFKGSGFYNTDYKK